MQELGCIQLPGTVYRSLQRGAMHCLAATWGDGCGWMEKQWALGPHHISLCIQNGINKMYLCSLSITYACPYHNKLLTRRHARCLPSALNSPGLICPWREYISKVPDAMDCEHLPTRVKYDDKLRMMGIQMSFDSMVSDSLCRNSLVTQKELQKQVCGCEASWMYGQILWNAFGDGLW